ncbi:MAG: ubiquitin-like small modifier protein 2 [Halodesulfurarchaeum sp.]
MEVTVDVLGGETHTVSVTDGTYSDVLDAVDLSPQEATVIIDGRPVPSDQPVEHDEVAVLRLVQGGCGMTRRTPDTEPNGDRLNPGSVSLRKATLEDHIGIMNVLDGANLAVDPMIGTDRIESGHVLIAESSLPVGVLLASPRSIGMHVEAIAVRRARRGRGIGTRLLDRAYDHWGFLTATFDSDIRSFYRNAGFAIHPNEDRCFGIRR